MLAIAAGVVALVALFVGRDVALRWFAHRREEREAREADTRIAALEERAKKMEGRLGPIEARLNQRGRA